MSEEIAADQVTTAADRFPFVMLLTTYFLQGSLFLLLNGPLLVGAIEGKSFPDSLSLLRDGLLKFWANILSSGAGFASLSILLLTALVVGILLTPIDKIVGVASCRGIERLARLLRRKPVKLFSSNRIFDDDYIPLIACLLARRTSKLHWEWELFLHNTYWGILTNVIMFAAFASFLRQPSMSCSESLAYVVLVLLFMSFAIFRSMFMARVHAYYLARFRDELKPPTDGAG